MPAPSSIFKLPSILRGIRSSANCVTILAPRRGRSRQDGSTDGSTPVPCPMSVGCPRSPATPEWSQRTPQICFGSMIFPRGSNLCLGNMMCKAQLEINVPFSWRLVVSIQIFRRNRSHSFCRDELGGLERRATPGSKRRTRRPARCCRCDAAADVFRRLHHGGVEAPF